ncbi:MAG: class I adenylate-forming enzyme family protein [Phycisphaerales bacterium]
MSIHWPILKQLLRHARKPVIVDDQRTLKAADILVAALHTASAIEAAGGSRTVGVLLPTGGAFPIAALACWMLGRVLVPLNYLLKPEELRFVVEDCGTDVIVTAGPMLDYIRGAHAAGAPTGPDAPDHPWLPDGVRLVRLEQLAFRSMPDLRWPAAANDDDLGVLLYTSGTSGKPKGVMLTHGNIRANIEQTVEAIGVDDREVLLGVLPQFHSFGLTVLTLLPLSLGAKAVYTARFIPGKLLRLIREHRPTILVAIPSMYNALLHSRDAQAEDFSSFRLVVSGGEPLPRFVADEFRKRFGVTITEGYGLTETSPVSNICLPSEHRPGSVGRPVPRMLQRIVNVETGSDLPPNADGEVRMKGPNVMRGYFNRPEETAAAFDADGWFRTGDIGRFDDDGHLHITGRLKEMLIVGGENVFPREIEEVLNAHPSVKDSGVVGKADPIRGELPIAFVELVEDAEGRRPAFNEKELLAWCRTRLAGYKVPDEIRPVEALPRNPTGKVMRRELKKIVS